MVLLCFVQSQYVISVFPLIHVKTKHIKEKKKTEQNLLIMLKQAYNVSLIQNQCLQELIFYT